MARAWRCSLTRARSALLPVRGFNGVGHVAVSLVFAEAEVDATALHVALDVRTSRVPGAEYNQAFVIALVPELEGQIGTEERL